MNDVLEYGSTYKFTWTGSTAPDSAPRLSIVNSAATLVYSSVALTLDAYGFYAFVPAPTPGWYLYEWLAQKTINGSVYDFIERGVFRTDRTQIVFP